MPQAGQRMRAIDFPATASDTQVTSGNVTSTTYTATLSAGTACGVSFTAPTSGKVEIANNCQLVNSTAGSNTYCSFRVGTGSTVGGGTAVVGESDDNAIINTGTNIIRVGVTLTVTGLTAGSVYNVQQKFKVSGNTGTFVRRHLSVKPAP